MSVLAVTLLVIQVSAVSGGLTVLRETKESWSYDRKLLCVSEDDGGGLVWNSNLNWQYSSYAFSDRAEATGKSSKPQRPRWAKRSPWYPFREKNT